MAIFGDKKIFDLRRGFKKIQGAGGKGRSAPFGPKFGIESSLHVPPNQKKEEGQNQKRGHSDHPSV